MAVTVTTTAATTTTASWRRMSPEDKDRVLEIGDKIHPDLPEDKEVLTERLRLFPEGCFVLVQHRHRHHKHKHNESDEDVQDDNETIICGYAVSHPIPKRHQPPALNTLLLNMNKPPSVSPGEAEQFYIHDLAILPEFRGRGYARECVDMLLGVAKRWGFELTGLVSVYGTERFWERFGFGPALAAADVDADAKLLKKIVSAYGQDAVYLVRRN